MSVLGQDQLERVLQKNNVDEFFHNDYFQMLTHKWLTVHLPAVLAGGISSWREECEEAINILQLIARQPILYEQRPRLRKLHDLVEAMEPFYVVLIGGGMRGGRNFGETLAEPLPSFCKQGDLDIFYPLGLIEDLSPQLFVLDVFTTQFLKPLAISQSQYGHFVFNHPILRAQFWEPFLRRHRGWLAPYIHEQATSYAQRNYMGEYGEEWFRFMEHEDFATMIHRLTKRRFEEMSRGEASEEEQGRLHGNIRSYSTDNDSYFAPA